MAGMIDAHHHIWRKADLPWLEGPMQPRIFGPYEPIRRDYLIEEYLADARACGIAKSVYVQANWAAERALDEVAWVQAVADAHGFPHAIVGYADFRRPDVGQLLDRQAQHPLMRGIRMQLHWHENPQYRFADGPAVMNESAFRRNFALLGERDWLFELQLFTSQMRDGAAFARAFRHIPMVLTHCGMPEDPSAEGLLAWRDGMAALAACPNVHVKLSGLGTFVHEIDQALITDIVGETIGFFGAERCLFGSNFPIEKLWTDYARLLAAYRQATATLSEREQRLIFHDTAARLYKIDG